MENSKYEYVLVQKLPIAEKGETFTLVNGYYINENETIALRSTNITGKIIKKIKHDRTQLC
jgi:hypothetical protein